MGKYAEKVEWQKTSAPLNQPYTEHENRAKPDQTRSNPRWRRKNNLTTTITITLLYPMAQFLQTYVENDDMAIVGKLETPSTSVLFIQFGSS